MDHVVSRRVPRDRSRAGRLWVNPICTVVLAALLVPLTVCKAEAVERSSALVADSTTTRIAAPAAASALAPTPPGRLLKARLRLRRQRDDLATLAAVVADPSSAQYRHFLSVREIAETYGAGPEARAGVQRWFAERGLKATIDTTGTFAQVDMDAATARSVFGLQVNTYMDASSRTFDAASGEATIPAGLAGWVEQVGGMSNRPLHHANVGVGRSPITDTPFYGEANWPAWFNRTGTPSPSNCAAGNEAGFTPDQLKTAYGITGSGLTGAGQNVAVLEPGGTVIPSDITTFAACFNLSAPNLHITSGDGTPVPTCTEATAQSCAEAALDVEVMASVATGASRLNVMTSSSGSEADPSSLADLLAGTLNPANTGGAPVDVISISDGQCEALWNPADIANVETELQTAAVAGVSVVVAAGDSGSTDCAWAGLPGVASVDYPASSPWVTSLGGTTLQLNSANQLTGSGIEAWNDWVLQFDAPGFCEQNGGVPPPCGATLGVGGGGGVSGSGAAALGVGTNGFSGFPAPSYQEAAGLAQPTRSVPDAALLADIGKYPVYCTVCGTGGWSPQGGTSAAAPLFASMVALLNEKVGSSLGFFNPLLYRLASTPPPTGLFDVTVGDNVVGPPPGPACPALCTSTGQYRVACCEAGPGFDLASGWGSILLDQFAPRVAAAVPPVGPPMGVTLEASPPTGSAPLPVALTAVAATSRPGPAPSYTWDYGDGTPPETTAAPVASHTYSTPGSYRAVVTVTNAQGSATDSMTVNVATPGMTFHPIPAHRALDTRDGTGGWPGPLVAGSPRTLDAAGLGVPATAKAVMVNVTATNPTAASFLTVYTSGSSQPATSNLNFTGGDTIANLVTARLDPDGQLVFANAAGSVDLVIDVEGYFDTTAGGSFFDMTVPTRALDSRNGTGGWPGPLVAGSPRTLDLAGGVIPIGATAAVMNVTVTNPTASSFLTAWQSGSAQPATSDLNYSPGETISNLVTVALTTPASGVSFANSAGTTDVVVDLVGYYQAGSGSYFHALAAPTRILDDRDNTGLFGPWGPGQTRSIPVSGTPSFPASASGGVVLNVTATNPTAPSFVTAHTNGQVLPPVSSLNFAAGQTIAHLVTVAPSATNGWVDLYNSSGSVDLVIDATGYYDTSA